MSLLPPAPSSAPAFAPSRVPCWCTAPGPPTNQPINQPANQPPSLLSVQLHSRSRSPGCSDGYMPNSVGDVDGHGCQLFALLQSVHGSTAFGAWLYDPGMIVNLAHNPCCHLLPSPPPPPLQLPLTPTPTAEHVVRAHRELVFWAHVRGPWPPCQTPNLMRAHYVHSVVPYPRVLTVVPCLACYVRSPTRPEQDQRSSAS